ncbi:MAG: glycine zipper 2TM domain-containing protein [Pseudomonadota bacterium]
MSAKSSLIRSVTGAVAVVAAIGLVGCENMNRQQRNTAAGAAIGGVAGSVLTGGSAAGTIGGAAVGGVIGHQTGK